MATFAKPIVVNVADTFSINWTNNKEATSSQRVKSFHENVVPQFPEFYKYRFNTLKKQARDVGQEIVRHFDEFSEISIEFSKLSKELPTNLENAILSFSERFKDFDSNFKIYLIHSLDEMDGGVRTVGDQEFFIFGLESMIKFHNFSNRTPFFHHELFHLYHFQVRKAEFREELWEYLWIEGLATYMSHVLNPTATYIDLALDVPEGLVNKCEKNFPDIIEALLASFDSKSPEVYAKFFLPNANDEIIPSRAAYYIGYLLAKEIAKTAAPATLVNLGGDALKLQLRKALQQLLRTHQNESHF